MTLGELADLTGGELRGASADSVVAGAPFVDSRRPVPGGIYVAIEGERVDGHDFAAGAVAGGAAVALTRRAIPGVPCLVVADPVEALGPIAHRVVVALPDLTVVGITGSQGKTSAKDILAQLLEHHGETVATEGSLNNEIGLPLTVAQSTSTTRYLVVEMGARGVGHIRYLAGIARPTVALVLNVGVAHIGEFGGREAIAQAKGELVEALPEAGVAVLNRDDPLVAAMAARTDARIVYVGRREADVWYRDVDLDDDGKVSFTLGSGEREARVSPGLVGEHQAFNTAAAAAAAAAAGMPFELILDVVPKVRPRSHWRMEIASSPSGLTIVNDAYNANPDSMRVALETVVALAQRHPGARTIAVLGEMRELGEHARDEHEAVGRLAAQLGIGTLVVVGEGARPIRQAASGEGSWDGESVWVADAAAAIAEVRRVAAPGDIVVVKASRAAGLEEVAAALLEDAETDA